MKQRKKRNRLRIIFVSVVCLMMACALSACAPSSVSSGEIPTFGEVITQSGNSGPTPQANIQTSAVHPESNDLTDRLEPVKLPDEYLITYEVIEDEQIDTVTKGRDQEGRVYFRSGGEELLFVPSANGRYQEYRPDSDGKLSPFGSSLCTESYVETATAEFMEYAQQSTKRFNGIAELSGTQEIVGRLCDLYTFDVTVLNFSNQYSLAIDRETGTCLLWQQVTVVSGHVTSEGGSFACTEFFSTDVELPVSY